MSSKRQMRRKMCGNKIKYTNIADAKRIRHNMHIIDWYMNVYRCPFCHSYHIGHAPSNHKGR